MSKAMMSVIAAFAIPIIGAAYAEAQDKQPSLSQQVQRSDPPPGDTQTGNKRGERAETPAPMSEPQAHSTAGDSMGKKADRAQSVARGAAQGAADDAARKKYDTPSMGESQKPYGKVGP